MTTEQKTVTIQARHEFSDAEFKAISQKIASSASDLARLESEFASIKKDFGARIQHEELERDTQIGKVRDGFEMRPVSAIVSYNDPTPGQKTYRFQSLAGMYEGSVIRVDPMAATDFQRDLPLDAITQAVVEELHREPVNPERFPETGDSAAEVKEARQIIQDAAEPIGTSLADKLSLAAQGAAPNPVVIDFGGKDDGNKCLAKWRKAARHQGWPEPCIDLIDGLAKDALAGTDTAGTRGSKQRVLDVLGSHSISEAEEYARVNAASCAENEKLAATFGASEGDAQ